MRYCTVKKIQTRDKTSKRIKGDYRTNYPIIGELSAAEKLKMQIIADQQSNTK